MTRQELEQIKALILQLSTKISSLPEATTLAGEDLFTIAKSEVGGAYTSKKMKMSVLAKTLKTRYPEINGSRFAGLASPRDEAFTPPTTTSLFWIAYTPGTYSAYGDIVVGDTPVVIVYDITTQQFSSLPLWEASSGTVKFSFADDTIVDNQVISQKIAVSYGNEYNFELNIQPTDSYEKIIVRQYNFNDVMLDVQEYDTIRPKVTPVKNASYIVFTVTYRDDNPVSAQNSYLLLTAPLSVLANDVYSYVSVIADKVLPDVWPWEAISGLPTTLEGYGITDAVDTTTFTTVLQSYYTKTESDTRFQPAGYYVQRTDLRYLHFVAGAFEADEFIQGITEKTIKVPTATAHLTNNGANGVNPFVTQGDIDTSLVPINALIPNQASSENQLADKAFVNSSIATNTANFKGTYNSVEALANITGADANDYAFVSSVDTAGNTLYSRYKYSSGSWLFEYTLNNSSFTSDQWTAINSGITDSLVAKLSALPTNDALTTALFGKVDVVYGKGLSTNDFTDTYLDYMSGLTTSNIYDYTIGSVNDSPVDVILNKKYKESGTWGTTTLNLSDYYQRKETGKGLSTNDYTTAEKNKLSAIEANAQVNIIEGVQVDGTDLTPDENKKINIDLSDKVDKVPGKGLSTEDYTTAEKTKLGALPTKVQLDASLDEKVDKSGKETKDEVFTYQQTGGGLTKNAKNARVVSYKGKTLAWNQMIVNGNFENATDGWGENGVTLSVNNNIATIGFDSAYENLTQKVYFINGHKYYVSLNANPNGSNIAVTNDTSTILQFSTLNSWSKYSTIYTFPGESGSRQLRLISNTAESKTLLASNFVIVDLTLMFGAGNEPTTVEEFESLFPESYYDYNAGTLISNEVKEIESVGFNLWDEECERGTIDWESYKITPDVTGGRLVPKNFIPVFSGAEYYFNVPPSGLVDFVIFAYTDKDSNGLILAPNSGIVIIPEGYKYLKFGLQVASYGATYNHDICINLSDTNKNGTYEPYKKYTHKINLNSFKVTDGTNVYTINGLKSAGNVYDEIIGNKYIKRVGRIDIGTLDYTKNTDETGRFDGPNLPNGKSTSSSYQIPNMICSKYSTGKWREHGTIDKVVLLDTTLFRVVDTSYASSTAEQFKSAMNGVYLYYELTTPIEYELVEPISTDYPVDKLGTERVISDNICPIRVSTEYHEANISDIQVENITDYLKKAELKKELNTELTKLDGIEEGAQENVIEHIKIGSTEQTISEKTVSLPASYPKADIADVAINNKTELKANQEFKFRKTNVDWDAKTEIVKKIYGKTLAWNQLANFNNVAITYWTVPVSSLKSIVNSIPSTHKICVKMNATITAITSESSPAQFGFGIPGNDVIVKKSYASIAVGAKGSVSTIFTRNSSEVTNFHVYGCGNDSVGKTGEARVDIEITDLTLMFGSGNEPSTVAEFESLFPLSYYPYNVGTLISNDASAIETVGRNVWDEEWEVGSYNNDTGEPISVGTTIRSKSTYPIPCLPSTTYFIQAPYVVIIFFYDKAGNFISIINKATFVTPANCYYIKFRVSSDYGTTYNHDICINLSDPAKNGTYEPYWKREMPLNLNNIKVKSHNIWDEEWEQGTINLNTGVNSSSTHWLRSKNYIPVFASTDYHIHAGTNYGAGTYMYFLYYDANKNFISYAYKSVGATVCEKDFTIPTNVAFLRFLYGDTSDSAVINTYNNDICINVSSSFNGQYEPHGDITITGGLKSAGSVKDEIVGNKYIKRVGSVDMGVLDWYRKSSGVFYCYVADKKNGKSNFIEPRYVALDVDESTEDKVMYGASTWYSLNLRDSLYDTVDALVEAISGNPVYYELVTPIEYELAEPMQSVVKVSQYGTESVVYEDNDVHAPFIADIQYGANSDDIIDNYDGVVKSLKNKLETLWNAVFNNS